MKKGKELTKEGKFFIIQTCNKLGSSVFSGGGNKSMPFTDYIDENGNNIPPIKQTWTAKPKFGNSTITTVSSYSNMLITLLNKYATVYNLDANYLAAVIYIESNFKLWEFPPEFNNSNGVPIASSASGLCQFLTTTIWDVVIQDRFRAGFTMSEKLLLCDGMRGDRDGFGVIVEKRFYQMGRSVAQNDARWNRRFHLHQNIMNNPEISIKAMAVYFNMLANMSNGSASSSLFGYNRGPKYARPEGYLYSIQYAKDDGAYVEEGIKYVYKSFKLLYEHFGYKHLNMDRIQNPYITS